MSPRTALLYKPSQVLKQSLSLRSRHLRSEGSGLVLIDHKCLGGTLTEALAAAASYGAQLAAYVDVLERATGRDVLGRWLHMPLQGVCVEVR